MKKCLATSTRGSGPALTSPSMKNFVWSKLAGGQRKGWRKRVLGCFALKCKKKSSFRWRRFANVPCYQYASYQNHQCPIIIAFALLSYSTLCAICPLDILANPYLTMLLLNLTSIKYAGSCNMGFLLSLSPAQFYALLMPILSSLQHGHPSQYTAIFSCSVSCLCITVQALCNMGILAIPLMLQSQSYLKSPLTTLEVLTTR